MLFAGTFNSNLFTSYFCFLERGAALKTKLREQQTDCCKELGLRADYKFTQRWGYAGLQMHTCDL